MKFLKLLIPFLTISIACFGLDLSHLNDYFFLDGKNHFEIQNFYTNMGNAPLKEEEFAGTDMHYTEWGSSGYVGGYLNRDNALCLQAGYSSMRLNWEQNPRFKQKDFNDLVLSLAWISNSVPDWRWVVDLGAHIDTKFYNLSKHTFYTGFLWGRLNYRPYMGFHYGLLGQIGVKSKYVLPIIGLDTFVSRRIQLNLVFPLDISGSYYFNRQWRFSIKYRSFGGWYRANHRVGNDEPLPGALVTQSSSGVDGGIYYKRYGISFGAFGGYDFGGWIFTQTPQKTEPRYYHFKSAPYVGGKLELAF